MHLTCSIEGHSQQQAKNTHKNTQINTDLKSIMIFHYITSVALAIESSGYVWLRAPNSLVHILLVIRLEHKFGCFSFIVASKG